MDTLAQTAKLGRTGIINVSAARPVVLKPCTSSQSPLFGSWGLQRMSRQVWPGGHRVEIYGRRLAPPFVSSQEIKAVLDVDRETEKAWVLEGTQRSVESKAADLDRLRRSEELTVGSSSRDSLELIEDLAESKADKKKGAARAQTAMSAKQGMLQLVAEYLRPDEGPSRWFSPTDSKPPFPNAPLMLFLPGIDGTGLGAIVQEEAIAE